MSYSASQRFASNFKSFTLSFKDSRYGFNFTKIWVFLSINSCATIEFSQAITITPPPSIEYGLDFEANFAPAAFPQNLYRLLRVIAFLNVLSSSNSAIIASVPTKSVYSTFFNFASPNFL